MVLWMGSPFTPCLKIPKGSSSSAVENPAPCLTDTVHGTWPPPSLTSFTTHLPWLDTPVTLTSFLPQNQGFCSYWDPVYTVLSVWNTCPRLWHDWVLLHLQMLNQMPASSRGLPCPQCKAWTLRLSYYLCGMRDNIPEKKYFVVVCLFFSERWFHGRGPLMFTTVSPRPEQCPARGKKGTINLCSGKECFNWSESRCSYQWNWFTNDLNV